LTPPGPPFNLKSRHPPLAMPSIDDELAQIERDIRTLKIEYEQYFGGGRPRPPTDTQWRVDNLVRRYNERGGELSSGQRFRFYNIQQTYAKYQDMWRKKLMQKEGAITQRHFGAAAKAIEAERARQAAHREQQSPPAPAAPAGHSVAVAHHPAEAHEPSQPAPVYAASIADPEHEHGKIQQLYNKLIEARKEAGEKSSAPTLNDFERFVMQKTQDLKDKGGHEIEYTVSIEGGRVKLKARISN
jgi:hypothetical protein